MPPQTTPTRRRKCYLTIALAKGSTGVTEPTIALTLWRFADGTTFDANYEGEPLVDVKIETHLKLTEVLTASTPLCLPLWKFVDSYHAIALRRAIAPSRN